MYLNYFCIIFPVRKKSWEHLFPSVQTFMEPSNIFLERIAVSPAFWQQDLTPLLAKLRPSLILLKFSKPAAIGDKKS